MVTAPHPNDRFLTISSQFSAIYINIFHKTFRQSVWGAEQAWTSICSKIMTKNTNGAVTNRWRSSRLFYLLWLKHMLLYELHLGNLSSNHCTTVDIQYINVLMYIYFQESILKTATKIKMSHLLKNATKCEKLKENFITELKFVKNGASYEYFNESSNFLWMKNKILISSWTILSDM